MPPPRIQDRTQRVGKLRGLQHLADARGLFTICAMDHRGSLEPALRATYPDGSTYQRLVQAKLDLCEALAPHASAVLLDPIYGAGQCIAAGLLPRDTGLLVSLEETGYQEQDGGRLTRLLPGWDARQIRRMGGTAAKLLLYFHPDEAATRDHQLDVVAEAGRGCAEEDLPFVVEPMSYVPGGGTKDSPAFAAEKPRVVAETARILADYPLDLLKTEFPADLRYEQDEGRLVEYCRRVSAASPVPWVVLSAGVAYEDFRRQVELACRGGASGFLGGRAIWQEAFQQGGREAARRFLRTTAAARLEELAEIAARHGRPWHQVHRDRYPEVESFSEDWPAAYHP
ncbi:MAG TPA: tagatose 1,6-diphosphate aldolase [Dehalococcoidia bacterium]